MAKKNFTIKENSIYRDFYVLNICTAKRKSHTMLRYYLRHKTTGLEVIYYTSSVPQNLFVLSVRTPAFDNSGIFHAIEHSVFQGSQKYPFPEVFTQLNHRTACYNTNACTTATRTSFYGDSAITSEALKIMDVMMDAVFFPLLTKEVFLQECWRLELNEKQEPELNGIVFNEVKNSFLDPFCLSEKSDQILKCQIPAFSYFCGGDPLEVPSITYENLIETHKKYYRPDNAMILYCGTMSVTRFLDHLADNYIPDLQKKFQMHEALPYWKSPYPVIQDESKKRLDFVIPQKKEYHLDVYVSDEAITTQNRILYIWDSLKYDSQSIIIPTILDYLLDSTITPQLHEISDTIEITSDSAHISKRLFITIFIDNIPKEKYQQVKNIFEEFLENLKKEGLPQRVIRNTITHTNLIDEITPELMTYKDFSSIINDWSLGYEFTNNTSMLEQGKYFLNRYIKKDHYLNSLFNKNFLNQEPLKIEYGCKYYPLEKFKSERFDKEQKLVKELFAKTTKDELIKQKELLEKYQKADHGQLISQKFPYPDLGSTLIRKNTEKIEFKKVANSVTLLYSESQNKTVIPTVSFNFPMDYIDPELLSQFQLVDGIFSTIFGKNPYTEEGVQIKALINTRKLTSPEGLKHSIEQTGSKDIPLRNWISIVFSIMPDDIKEAFKTFKNNNFPLGHKFTNSDKARTKDFPPWGESMLYNYAMYFYSQRLLSTVSEQSAIEELINGYTGCKNEYDFTHNQSPEFFDKFEKFFTQMTEGGCICFASCTSEHRDLIFKEINKVISKFNLQPLKPRINRPLTDYLKYILNGDTSLQEIIPVKKTIGSCYGFIPLETEPGSRENLALTILCDWLNNNPIQARLRVEHGCYDATMTLWSGNGLVAFSTSQDPDPEESIRIFKEIICQIGNKNWTEEDIKEIQLEKFTINSIYKSPEDYLDQIQFDLLTGTTIEDENEQINRMYTITPDEIHQVAIKLSQNADKFQSTMIPVLK